MYMTKHWDTNVDHTICFAVRIFWTATLWYSLPLHKYKFCILPFLLRPSLRMISIFITLDDFSNFNLTFNNVSLYQ